VSQNLGIPVNLMGTRNPLLGVKWPEHTTDHYLQLVPRSGTYGTLPSHPLYAFMACYLGTGVTL